MFQTLQANISREVIQVLSRVQLAGESDLERMERQRREERARRMNYSHADGTAPDAAQPNGQPRAAGERTVETFVRGGRKVGRNESCPCGSGKKYKHCCGRPNAA